MHLLIGTLYEKSMVKSTRPTPPPKFSAIIIHWNTPELLRKLLTQLPVSDQLEVIVVDNHSSQSLEELKNDFASVAFIDLHCNAGYAVAANRGATEASGAWLVFLNCDSFVTPELLEVWLKQATENRLLASSPQSCVEGYALPILTPLSMLAQYTPIAKIGRFFNFGSKTLTGGLLLIQSSIFRQLCGFDERFFLWFEDSDLSLRLQHQKVAFGFVDLLVDHQGGSSFKNLDNQLRRDVFFHSLEVFARKHWNPVSVWIARQIRLRYSSLQTLPDLDQPTTVVVPNCKPTLLTKFISNNTHLFTDSRIEICIVSSGLTTELVWELRKDFPSARVVSIEKNFGFAHTVNIGLRTGRSQWIGTTNDDTIVPIDCFAELLKNCREKTGSIAPIVNKTDGSVESAGIAVLKKGKAIPNTLPPTETVSADANNAACVLYNQQALSKVGLFDESFESYLEDVELSLRLKSFNWKNLVAPSVTIVHLQHQTSGGNTPHKTALDFRNWWRIIYLHWSLEDLLRYCISILVERVRNASGYGKTLAR